MRALFLWFALLGTFQAHADGLCDALLVETRVPWRGSFTPLAADFAALAARTTPRERRAIETRLRQYEPNSAPHAASFAADVLSGEVANSVGVRVARAEAFTLKGRAEIETFFERTGMYSSPNIWQRGPWVTPLARIARLTASLGALIAAGYTWLPLFALEPTLIGPAVAVVGLGSGAAEAWGHAQSRVEQRGVRSIENLFADATESSAPVFLGRYVGETGVWILFTPATQTLDITWTYVAIDDP